MEVLVCFEAIGTHWQIDIDSAFPVEKKEELLRQIKLRIDLFDKTYSRFRQDSLVTRMSRHTGRYQVPDDARDLMAMYEKLYEITHHAFTPFIGNVLAQAGYDAEYSLKPKKLYPPPGWECIAYTHPIIHVMKPVLLDFGAAGKGYLVDIIGKILKKNMINTYAIDAGGDILYKNSENKKIRVGLEHPENQQQVIGIANLLNGSICCSAGNRRKWKDFHHIINPHTLASPKHILSTWVLAEKALLADALATALFFVPAKVLLSHFNFSYALVNADYALECSKDFPGEFYTTQTSMTP